MQKVYRGSCHCNHVTFELDADIKYVIDCNCSICRPKGALWHSASESSLRILSGESDLTLYQFNTMTAKHYFCKHCGIHPFTRPRLDPSTWIVNVRCLHKVDLTSLKVQLFDGEHWEEAASAFHSQQRMQPAG
jgi:hypothetical protein